LRQPQLIANFKVELKMLLAALAELHKLLEKLQQYFHEGPFQGK